MTLYTDKQYYMEPRLISKLDLMCDRCSGKKKFDNLIVIDGDEGYGKSTLAVAVAYYMAHKTGRKFDVDHITFEIDKLIEYARTHEDQILVWDEAALGGLSDQFRSKIQTKLLQLLMVARKKRHIYIFNIPKFFKLREYIILDRAIALIHVYARNELELGRFVYFSKKKKERLFYNFGRTKQRNYKKFYDFRGTFPDVLSKLIDEEEYDRKKDEAILSIGENDKIDPHRQKMIQIQYNIGHLPDKIGISVTDFAKMVGIHRNTMYEWQKLDEKYPEIIENAGCNTQ